jgi:glutaredoxin 3
MAAVTAYVKSWCPYCQRALALLETKPVDVEVLDVDDDPARYDEMVRKSGGRRTVPQIFIGERHVGGSDELSAANARGDLDNWLSAEAVT